MTTQYSALYDELGPRALRRVRVATSVVTVMALAAVALVVVRLADQGQLEPDKWSPLFNPFDQQFGVVWTFLLGGLWNTAQAGLLAVLLSLVFGTLLAVSRVASHRSYRWLIVGTMEAFRSVPVVISIFLASRFLPIVGIDLPLLWYLVIGLTIYNSVAIAEIVRAGIMAVPSGQSEASAALGFSAMKTMRLVVLPQAFRLMLPVLISQLVIVIKDSALGFIIGFEELLRRGEIAVQTLHNPLQMYLLIGLLFIVVNSALSKAAEAVERRLGAAVAPRKSLAPRRRPTQVH